MPPDLCKNFRLNSLQNYEIFGHGVAVDNAATIAAVVQANVAAIVAVVQANVAAVVVAVIAVVAVCTHSHGVAVASVVDLLLVLFKFGSALLVVLDHAS